MNRNIYLFAKVRYPWLKNLPYNWPMMVMMLEAYKPLIQTIMVNWRALDNGFLRVILMGLLKVILDLVEVLIVLETMLEILFMLIPLTVVLWIVWKLKYVLLKEGFSIVSIQGYCLWSWKWFSHLKEDFWWDMGGPIKNNSWC